MTNGDNSAAEWNWLWRESASLLPQLSNSIHLWSVRLDRDDLAVEQLASLLTQEERDRASRYRFVTDRNRFIVRRWILRRILARYLQTEPQDVRFRVGEFGRLELAGLCRPMLGFSVTHSQGMALIAVARTHFVGVDLERLRSLPDLELMIDECLSVSEKCHIQALPEPLRLEYFYRYWTCKEASLKAMGIGLNRRLDSIRVSLTASGFDCQAEIEEGGHDSLGVSVWSFIPFRGYVAATTTARAGMPHALFAI